MLAKASRVCITSAVAQGDERLTRVLVYQDGYFSYNGTSHWLACKEAGGSQIYSIFAPTGDVNQNDCERIKLVTVASTEPKEGAYSYT
jgi:hypothetical protein